MKRAIIIMLLVLAVPCLPSGRAMVSHAAPPETGSGSQVAELGPEHKKLQVWVGDWTFRGEDRKTAFQPERVYTGKATVRPMLGGAFVEWLGEDSDGASWREIDGYDPVNKRFFWHTYYPDGSVEVLTYRIEGSTVSLSGTTDIAGKQARLRGTCEFAADRTSFVERLQVSLDGGKTWIQAWEIRFTKTKPSTPV